MNADTLATQVSPILATDVVISEGILQSYGRLLKKHPANLKGKTYAELDDMTFDEIQNNPDNAVEVARANFSTSERYFAHRRLRARLIELHGR